MVYFTSYEPEALAFLNPMSQYFSLLTTKIPYEPVENPYEPAKNFL